MRRLLQLAAAISLGMAPFGGHALANVCQTKTMMCATTMPVDGYCECTAHGTIEDGTVVPTPPPQQHLNASAGGCGLHPNDPGCRGGANGGPPRQ